MNRIKYLFVIECLLIIGGCGSRQQAGDIFVTDIPAPSVVIDPDCPIVNLGIQLDSYDRNFFEQCVDDFRLIPLETAEEYLIGNISNMAMVNDTLIIVDADKAQKIFLFDMNGRFIRTVGSLGEGPDEYQSLSNVSFFENNILLHDWTRARCQTYDLSGNVIDRQRLKRSRPHNIAKINDTIIAGSFVSYDTALPYAVEWIDRNDSVIATARPFRYKRNRPAGQFVKTTTGQLLYYRMDSDTIFEITPDNLKPAYTLGIRIDYNTLMQETGSLDDKDFHRALYSNDNMPVNQFSILDLDNHWLITVQKGTKSYCVLYDTTSHRSRTFLRTDIARNECLIPFITYRAGKDLLLSNINCNFIEQISKEDRNRLYESLKRPEIKSTVENYDFDNNNPIVCLIKLKKP